MGHQVLVLDLDLVRISCVDGIDSPTVKFVRRLMLCPIGIGCILITWAVKKCLGQKMHFDSWHEAIDSNRSMMIHGIWM